ncbi:hypothetical protein PB1_00255 [Bacillus methanolicus PB1]|uniref:Uncharacterized protein n=1 Tax=Bacillus methanolicus PB1 TaxID=997296 RepID=I3E4A9_BACMT|nr:hypothetical protein PB1_00255 [Bacillus methanolicus PB1]
MDSFFHWEYQNVLIDADEVVLKARIILLPFLVFHFPASPEVLRFVFEKRAAF